MRVHVVGGAHKLTHTLFFGVIRVAQLSASQLENQAMSAFTVTFSAHDRANNRNLFFKADGKRFGSDRTLKVCCDVKYEVTVTVKPPMAPLK